MKQPKADAVPAQVFSRAQSEPAVTGARKFVETAEALVG